MLNLNNLKVGLTVLKGASIAMTSFGMGYVSGAAVGKLDIDKASKLKNFAAGFGAYGFQLAMTKLAVQAIEENYDELAKAIEAVKASDGNLLEEKTDDTE